VSDDATHDHATRFEYFKERVDIVDKQVEAAGKSLRDTARWIISGIAVATVGVIAGTSLSSLGALGPALGPECRLFVACLAAAVGIAGLGVLFAYALGVIDPPTLTLREVADGTQIPADWRKKIETSLKPLLLLASLQTAHTLKTFSKYSMAPTNPDGSALRSDEKLSFSEARRLIDLTISADVRQYSFARLKRRTILITPIITAASVMYAWAANPAKDDPRVVPVLEKVVEVAQSDTVRLEKILGTPACAGPKLDVIVLSEWRSGAQNVVTVPTSSCPPVRLVLDQGRFSPAR